MKLFRILFTASSMAAILFAGCKSDETPAGDPELFRVEDFLRPQKTVKEIKTADMLYKIENDRDDSILVRLRYRAPNRFRMDFSVKKLHAVCSVEGPTKDEKENFKGWQFDRLNGMKTLVPEEVQEFYRETVKFPFYPHGLAYFYENSDKIGIGILNHENCWLFTCQPEPFRTREQLLIWIGQQTKQIRLVEIGEEKVVHFFQYEDFGGLKLPRHIYESGKQGISKTTLVSASWNGQIPLSVFLPPVTEKEIKLEDGRTLVNPVLLEKTENSVVFAHKDGTAALQMTELPPAVAKKIIENEKSARKLQTALEKKEAEEAKIEAEKAEKKAREEAKENENKPITVKRPPRPLSAGEKKQNEIRDAILNFQITDLEKRLAEQKKSGFKSHQPARYGFFVAGPNFFRDIYVQYYTESPLEVTPAPKADEKAAPAAKADAKAAPAAKADAKAAPKSDAKADKKTEKTAAKK